MFSVPYNFELTLSIFALHQIILQLWYDHINMKYLLILVVVIAASFLYMKLSSSVIVGDKVFTPGQKFTYTDKDVFTYDVLYADSPKYQAIDKGLVTEKQFSDAFDQFPWKDQLDLADKLKIQSATISAHDQLNHMTLFISPSINSQTGEMGFVLGITNSVPDSSKDAVTINGSADPKQIHLLIQKFFARDQGVKDFLVIIKN